MKKIGILNCSHIYNYGSVLQSYAMEKVVGEITGYDTYSVRYRQKKGLRYIKNYFPLIFEKDIVKFKLKGVKRKIYIKFINKSLGENCKKREHYFQKFVNDNFNFTETYTTINELNKMSLEYSKFVLGSDQVWHPINYGSHYYTMEWIPEQIKKITYAASFGVSNIPKYQIKGTKKFLGRIDNISVREQQGAQIVYDMINKKVPVVVDPTLLLDSDMWGGISANIQDKDYIFCYFLGDNKMAREMAIAMKKKTGKKIFSIPCMDEINLEDLKFGDKQLYDVGPSEFLSYIKNAAYVITDSFHGTVFSVLFNKQFVVYNRYNNKNKNSTNSRIDTLLLKIELENRRVLNNCSTEESVNILLGAIDYSKVNFKISELKSESIEYLKCVLKECDK